MNPLDIMMKRVTFGENDILKDEKDVCTNGIYT
jgi:hypothetical protein